MIKQIKNEMQLQYFGEDRRQIPLNNVRNITISFNFKVEVKYYSTVGPPNLRSFYLRIRLFAVLKNTPNLRIRGLFLAYPRFFSVNMYKTELKLICFIRTVLPRYSRFHYSR